MRKILTLSVAAIMAVSVMGCGASADSTAAASDAEAVTESSAMASSEDVSSDASTEASSEEQIAYDGTEIRVGSLKGPTTMGLVNLMKDSENSEAEGNYTFTMETQPDTLMAEMVSGDLDIALVPANMAAVLYNKTEGGVSVIDVNTLGVLYCITADTDIKSVADLSGKTVITTGQGATPEYALNYLLEKNNVTDCNVEFKSEATEIASALSEDPTQIAILPQPFATATMLQNDKLSIAFSLTDEWDKVSDDSVFMTGVTVVSNSFLADHEDAVDMFLKEHSESADKAVSDVDTTAALTAEYGIIEKEAVAAKALPYCNIVCIKGDEMKTDVSGYLQTLFDQNPKSVGGTLPGDDFYYIQK